MFEVGKSRSPVRAWGVPRFDAWLERQVRPAVLETLGVEDADLALGVSLVDDLGADSLDLVELSLALEEHLGIKFPDHVMEQCRTYDQLLVAVSSLLYPGLARRVLERQSPSSMARVPTH